MKDKTFYINNQSDWLDFKKEMIPVNNNINNLQSFKSFEIKFTTGRRTGKQLIGYWVLIEKCKNFFYECGEVLSKEDTSDWFLIQLDYYKVVKGMIKPFSLSHKGNITKDMMIKLIEYIENFGREHNIKDCYIKEKEKDILINKYKNA